MAGLVFGTGGVPLSTPKPGGTVLGIEHIARLGLECLELEFVHGVRMSPQTAAQVRETAIRHSVRLTVHGPYAINLNSSDAEKVAASRDRVLQAARVGATCGAEGVVFHAAFYGEDPPPRVYDTVRDALAGIVAELRAEGNNMLVRPELTGKGTQFGSLDEVVRLAADIEGVLPCIDFAHLHARAGGGNSYDEFTSLLRKVESALGRRALDNLHAHVSGVQYGKHGEVKHLDLQHSDLQYPALLQALKDHNVIGTVVCESPNLEDDALLLQRTYRDL